jgi:hypothetical protein
MADIELCAECKAPKQFVDTHLWLGGGTIVQSGDRKHRMVLVESDNLDPLFKGIEELIGMPLERIVIETKRRATRDYLNRMIPATVKDLVQSFRMDIEPLIEAVNITGHVLGYGDSSLVEVRYTKGDDDYVIERIAKPYSVLLWCGDLAGSSEAVVDRDHDVKYEFISPDVVEIKAWPAPRPQELKERLLLKEYGYIDGDIYLRRCPSCGGPAALSGYAWDIRKGLIKMKDRDRRVAMLGPAYLEAVFDELERELGEDIPRVVVEAQRRFTRGELYSPEEIKSEEGFRDLLALRGLGNLREMAMDGKKLRVRIQNVAIHLMVAGLIQGYFEDVTGQESNIEWELKEDGTLELEVTPKK